MGADVGRHEDGIIRQRSVCEDSRQGDGRVPKEVRATQVKLSFVVLLFVSCAMPPHVELPEQLPQVPQQSRSHIVQEHAISKEEARAMMIDVQIPARNGAIFDLFDHIEYSAITDVARLLKYMTSEAVVAMAASTTMEDFNRYRRAFDEIERLTSELSTNIDEVRNKALQLQQELPTL